MTNLRPLLFLLPLLAGCESPGDAYQRGRQDAYMSAYEAISAVMEGYKVWVCDSQAVATHEGLNWALTAVVNQHGGLPQPASPLRMASNPELIEEHCNEPK